MERVQCQSNVWAFVSYTVSKCIAKKKKNNDALCSSSDQCVSGYCESSSPCSPGSCWSCTDQSSCDAVTGCNFDTSMAPAVVAVVVVVQVVVTRVPIKVLVTLKLGVIMTQ